MGFEVFYDVAVVCGSEGIYTDSGGDGPSFTKLNTVLIITVFD